MKESWPSSAPIDEVIEFLEEVQEEHPDAKLMCEDGDGTSIRVEDNMVYDVKVKVDSKW